MFKSNAVIFITSCHNMLLLLVFVWSYKLKVLVLQLEGNPPSKYLNLSFTILLARGSLAYFSVLHYVCFSFWIMQIKWWSSNRLRRAPVIELTNLKRKFYNEFQVSLCVVEQCKNQNFGHCLYLSQLIKPVYFVGYPVLE